MLEAKMTKSKEEILMLAGLALHTGISEIEKEIGVPKDFVKNFEKENDWSFVIKCHALLEAAITRLLTLNAGHGGKLNSIFERLELSNTTTGKLAFVSKLELLDKEHRRFIKTFSEIRNEFVHDVKNTAHTLQSYIDEKNKDKKKSIVSGFRGVSPDTTVSEGVTDQDIYKHIIENLREVMFVGTLRTLLYIHVKIEESKKSNTLEILGKQILEWSHEMGTTDQIIDAVTEKEKSNNPHKGP